MPPRLKKQTKIIRQPSQTGDGPIYFSKYQQPFTYCFFNCLLFLRNNMYSSALILKLILCTHSLLRYGGRHTVTMMPGEGIGPEMMGYVKQVYKEAAVPVDFEMIELDPKGGTEDTADLYNVIKFVILNLFRPANTLPV